MPEEATTTATPEQAPEQNREIGPKTEASIEPVQPVSKKGRPKKEVEPTPEPTPEPEVRVERVLVIPEVSVRRIASFFRRKMAEYWEKPVYGKTHTWQAILSFGASMPFVIFLDVFLFIVSLFGDHALVTWAIEMTAFWLFFFVGTVSIFTLSAHETYIDNEIDRVEITTGLSVIQSKNSRYTILGIHNNRVEVTRAELLLLLRNKRVQKFAGVDLKHPIPVKTESPQEQVSAVPVGVPSPSTIEKAAPV